MIERCRATSAVAREHDEPLAKIFRASNATLEDGKIITHGAPIRSHRSFMIIDGARYDRSLADPIAENLVHGLP